MARAPGPASIEACSSGRGKAGRKEHLLTAQGQLLWKSLIFPPEECGAIASPALIAGDVPLVWRTQPHLTPALPQSPLCCCHPLEMPGQPACLRPELDAKQAEDTEERAWRHLGAE